LADRGAADVLLVFVDKRAEVRSSLAKAAPRLADGGVLWLAYPKARLRGTDLNRDELARAIQAEGLEPVSQIAIDDVWSALRVKRDEALSAAREKRGAFATKKAGAKKTAATKKAGAKKTGAKKAATTKKAGAKRTAATKNSPAKKTPSGATKKGASGRARKRSV
jgi:hypothetical protein